MSTKNIMPPSQLKPKTGMVGSHGIHGSMKGSMKGAIRGGLGAGSVVHSTPSKGVQMGQRAFNKMNRKGRGKKIQV